jgi:hypothetical protein
MIFFSAGRHRRHPRRAERHPVATRPQPEALPPRRERKQPDAATGMKAGSEYALMHICVYLLIFWCYFAVFSHMLQ